MYVSERDFFLYESYTKIVNDAHDVHNCYDIDGDCSWLFFDQYVCSSRRF